MRLELAVICLACGLACGSVATVKAQEPSDAQHAQRMKQGLALFQSDVRRILEENCLKCHNPQSRKADFDLSNRKSLLENGHLEGGSNESYLMQLVRHEEEPAMPLKTDKLSVAEIKSLANWIDLGAPYTAPLGEFGKNVGATSMQVSDADRQFWSFRPLQKNGAPAIDDPWCRTEVDQFIVRQLQDAELTPNSVADRRTLIRRAYFDLLGLPPHPKEVEAFLSDGSDDAYSTLIDRLLQSRHYGERWARHWLDVARFGESSGFEHDDDRPHAYHYRDFVIRAFNDDMPFDQFVRWQVAGDEIAPEEPLALMATGFLGAGPFATQVTETEFESTRYDELDDMVANTGLAFLGLSFGCARCHDHKFDPIPTRDYYSLAAVFGKTVRAEIDVMLEPATAPTKVQVTAEGFPAVKNHSVGRGYKHFYNDVFLLRRGDVQQKEDVVQPGFANVLMHGKKRSSDWKKTPPTEWQRSDFRRSSLADWLTDVHSGAGSLAARVIVNRIWLHHFGRGIVDTPNDFGIRGEAPTHPQLLDYLAAELIENNWSLKHIHRLIMTSSVYQQSDTWDSERAAIDRDGRFYWRYTPRRLEAEAIRDNMLAVSGQLDRSMFGPGSLDESMRRRSVYFTIKRSKLISSMMLFDWPEHLVSIGKRSMTITAPQALQMMNNPQTRAYAKGLADRLAAKVGKANEGQSPEFRPAIEYAYEIVYGRPPNAQEVSLSNAFLQRQSEIHRRQHQAQSTAIALLDFSQMLMSANEFVFIR